LQNAIEEMKDHPTSITAGASNVTAQVRALYLSLDAVQPMGAPEAGIEAYLRRQKRIGDVPQAVLWNDQTAKH
jgi:hypothetical protein